MSSPIWKAAIPTIEYRVCSTVVGVVAPRSASPAPTSPIPPHCRRWSLNPKRRSASTASTTKPPAITAWATESGASAMAPTWNTQPTTATAHPIAHHFDRNRSVALLSGARRLTAGAATAPRCFHRNPRFVAIAVATANTNPMSSRSSIVPSRSPSPGPVLLGSRRLGRSNATGPRVSADRQDASAQAETRSRSRFLLVAVDSRPRHVDPSGEHVVVVVPAHTPHSFKRAGDDTLRVEPGPADTLA